VVFCDVSGFPIFLALLLIIRIFKSVTLDYHVFTQAEFSGNRLGKRTLLADSYVEGLVAGKIEGKEEGIELMIKGFPLLILLPVTSIHFAIPV
jgi:hypothetical protein